MAREEIVRQQLWTKTQRLTRTNEERDHSVDLRFRMDRSVSAVSNEDSNAIPAGHCEEIGPKCISCSGRLKSLEVAAVAAFAWIIIYIHNVEIVGQETFHMRCHLRISNLGFAQS